MCKMLHRTLLSITNSGYFSIFRVTDSGNLDDDFAKMRA
jgi:hypothetical protein